MKNLERKAFDAVIYRQREGLKKKRCCALFVESVGQILLLVDDCHMIPNKYPYPYSTHTNTSYMNSPAAVNTVHGIVVLDSPPRGQLTLDVRVCVCRVYVEETS